MHEHRSIRRHARRLTRASVAAIVSGLLALSLAGTTSAHPLGNFTINLYNGLTLAPDRVVLDRVVDMAEIPALQARQLMDTDADGAVSDVEGAAWAESTCSDSAGDLRLAMDGARVALAPVGVGLTFPAGQAGLLTLRLVCTYEAAYALLAGPVDVEFGDHAFIDRIGWREIVARGSGVSLAGADDFAVGSSDRLRTYPPATVEAPRAQSTALFTVAPGGASAAPEPVTDAVPIGSDASLIVRGATIPAAMPGATAELPAQLGALLHAGELSLPAIALAMAVAVLVGAVHAASPGHGKTLMAAYLVGTRGTVRHALGLGLTVTVSHTVGVLALGALVVFAGALVPSERLFPILGLLSGLVVTALGVALLVQRIAEARRRRSLLRDEHVHGHAHAHDDHAQGEGWHSHGPVRHTHLPTAAASGRDANPLRWRNLAALGLVGGLVPSASAILILVGSIAAGRPAFGMLLTVCFGLGMAVVLVGVGVLLVRARDVVARWPSADRLAPLLARLPLVTAAVFLIVGATITIQAGAQLT